jgi:hypothetical protein
MTLTEATGALKKFPQNSVEMSANVSDSSAKVAELRGRDYLSE